MKNRSAFVLLEFVMSIVVVGLIAVAGSKMLINLQRQNYLNAYSTQTFLELQNALDTIRNHLLQAYRDSISYHDNFLSWHSQGNLESSHQVFLKNSSLYLDGFLVFGGVSDFKIVSNSSGFEILLCSFGKNPLCARRLVLLWD